jgi:hypothetical protein
MLAVTSNGHAIVSTTIFGFVIVWLYAILAHATMADTFIDEDDDQMCTSLALCWVNALNEGLRGGDIGAIMAPAIEVVDDDPWMFAWIVFYELSFYATVITVLLNVIFGIIIDTFAELRTARATKKDNMENTCFVCGLDRFTFDTKGGGFDRHIWEDHNMWCYLFLIVRLRETDETELNGWESYVKAKVDAEEVSWMPRNTAIVLKEFKAREEEEQKQLASDVQALGAQQSELLRRLDALTKTVEQNAQRSDDKLSQLLGDPEPAGEPPRRSERFSTLST